MKNEKNNRPQTEKEIKTDNYQVLGIVMACAALCVLTIISIARL